MPTGTNPAGKPTKRQLESAVTLGGALLVAITLAGCGMNKAKTSAQSTQPVTPPAAARAMTYTAIQTELLSSDKCQKCHGATGKQTHLTSYEEVMDVVTAGDPDNSELFQKLKSGDMPPKFTNKTVDADMIEGIRLWIVQGAKNN